MGSDKLGYYVGIFFGIILILKWALKSINVWFIERKLGTKTRKYLPPGDFGWPFIGNMWSFLRAYKSTDPDSFIDNFVRRFGSSGIYKSFMFGNPSIIVTVPEACRKVLFDDDAFKPGWPISTHELIGKKSFVAISYEDHKRLRKLTASPVNGHEALSLYMNYIEANVVASLEKWSKMGKIEFLTQLRKLTFRIIMHIFLSSESEDVMEALEKEYTVLNYGVRALAINYPGFVYHKALKARKRLVAILQGAVTKRRNQRELSKSTTKMDMLDALLDTADDNGKKLDDEEIIDTLVMYLNAGHESSGHITMWATVLLQSHPEFLRIAKEEQERIVKNMPPGQKGLTLKEFRQMEYLSKVIDETLRLVTFSLMTFREAKKDVEIKGYIIPKGWKVLVWFRSVHHSPEVYPQPKVFNPSRWDDLVPKPGTFLPFGAGSRLCPGNDLAKLEIAIFLHHFLLHYQLERENPECPIMYLPHSRPKDNCLGRVIKVSK
ncbi:ent-kaurenoic acid oxidase 1-like [Rutidosis leptorrhynchoides]|uniref:ent-kaurenoic acid oxidase 1-like n=1 Tax=Rutidosis leptorrhynchoides TaxID=125765 RepID=UPI003A996E13